MEWDRTLLAFEEDVRNRGLLDWIKAHTSGFKPLHRYEGTLKLGQGRLSFEGRDVKEGSGFRLEIPLSEISDLHYGFDEVFKGREERAWPWNKPLRIRYREGGGERSIYLFARFHHEKGIRTSANRELYAKLRELLSSWKSPIHQHKI